MSFPVQDVTISVFDDHFSLVPAILCEARMKSLKYQLGSVTSMLKPIRGPHHPQNEAELLMVYRSLVIPFLTKCVCSTCSDFSQFHEHGLCYLKMLFLLSASLFNLPLDEWKLLKLLPWEACWARSLCYVLRQG